MIEVIDNFLTQEEIKILYEEMWYSDWYLIGSDYPNDSIGGQGWSFTKYFDVDKESNQIYRNILNKISELPQIKDKYVCERSLRNAYKFGDLIGLHKDVCYEITALIYGNKEWKINWGAETIFTDSESQDSEIIKSVIPKPGRLVLFDS